VELKCDTEHCNVPPAFGYQSYQSGIEIDDLYFEGGQAEPYQSYQSGIEIEKEPFSTGLAAFYQSYQSGIEMGIYAVYRLSFMQSINRTKVELKFRINPRKHPFTHLSIVPKWN